jgi:hypothetical protein
MADIVERPSRASGIAPAARSATDSATAWSFAPCRNSVGHADIGKAAPSSFSDHCAIMASVPSTWAAARSAGRKAPAVGIQIAARGADQAADLRAELPRLRNRPVSGFIAIIRAMIGKTTPAGPRKSSSAPLMTTIRSRGQKSLPRDLQRDGAARGMADDDARGVASMFPS